MDFSSFIAKRTRYQEALYLRKKHEEMKKKNGGNVGSSSNPPMKKENVKANKTRVCEEPTFNKSKGSRRYSGDWEFLFDEDEDDDDDDDDDELIFLKHPPNPKTREPEEVITISSEEEEELLNVKEEVLEVNEEEKEEELLNVKEEVLEVNEEEKEEEEKKTEKQEEKEEIDWTSSSSSDPSNSDDEDFEPTKIYKDESISSSKDEPTFSIESEDANGGDKDDFNIGESNRVDFVVVEEEEKKKKDIKPTKRLNRRIVYSSESSEVLVVPAKRATRSSGRHENGDGYGSYGDIKKGNVVITEEVNKEEIRTTRKMKKTKVCSPESSEVLVVPVKRAIRSSGNENGDGYGSNGDIKKGNVVITEEVHKEDTRTTRKMKKPKVSAIPAKRAMRSSGHENGDGYGSNGDVKKGNVVITEEVDKEDIREARKMKKKKVCSSESFEIPSVPAKRELSPVTSVCNDVVKEISLSFNNLLNKKNMKKENNIEPTSHKKSDDVSNENNSPLGNDKADDSNDLIDDFEIGSENESGEDNIEKEEGAKGEGEVRNSAQASKKIHLFELFVNTIRGKGEGLGKKPIPFDNGDEEQEMSSGVGPSSNPLKFNFGREPPKPPKEKSDYEMEMEELWADMDFVLKSIEVGSFGSSTAEYANEEDVEMDPSKLCGSGKHQLFLDEQIGIRCRICSFVELEIRYILPSLITSPYGERFSRRTAFDDGDLSFFGDLNLNEKGGDLHGFHDNTKRTVWDKFPSIRMKMYPHQQEGFEFLWRNIAGGIDLDGKKINCSNDIGGCVISHAPGTGKTFLTIAFLRTYMDVFKDCRPVIIAPCSMLLTWQEEFKKWKVDIPFHNLNSKEFSGKEDEVARKLIKDQPQWSRIVKLLSWSRGNSILGLSYNLFENLAGIKSGKIKKENLHDNESEYVRKILLEEPNLLVLDEGHTPRNTRSNIWKALTNIKTEKRIILSGTPFQNNFEELYNTLWLVRPKFADRLECEEKMNHGRGKGKEKWASITSSIGKNADDRLLEKIKTMIDPFVHVHRGSILQKKLPGLKDCVVILNPPPLQKELLEGIQGIGNLLELEHLVSVVSVHASLLASKNLVGKGGSLVNTIKPLMDKHQQITTKSFRLDPNQGVKTRFLMELIRLSDAMNEKVLVFSQYIDPTSLIKEQLQSHFNWSEGKEILQLNGLTDVKLRQSSINLFNDPSSEVKVLLASTKACGEGINLIGASRIVLLDVVWNPSVERQAISRAYRLGQRRVVYTYHLITSGTMEGEKYYRQLQKDHLSELVFSNAQGQSECPNPLRVSDDKILDVMVGHEKLKDMFEKIIYQPKETNLIETFGPATTKHT